MKDDLTLQKDVEEELWREPLIDSAHIGVIANNGVVTLTGIVTSYAQKYTAEQVPKRVYGVTAVADEIEVKLPSDARRSDTDIATAAIGDRRVPPFFARVANGSTIESLVVVVHFLSGFIAVLLSVLPDIGRTSCFFRPEQTRRSAGAALLGRGIAVGDGDASKDVLIVIRCGCHGVRQCLQP